MTDKDRRAPLITIDQANDKLWHMLEPKSTQSSLPLEYCLGRICAHDIHAPADVPAFNASAMDGYGGRSTDLRSGEPLRIVGTSLAGHPVDCEIRSGEVIRIFTGAVVPTELDTVVIQENVTVENDTIRIHPAPEAGANVRRAGNDIQSGARLLKAGQRLSSFDLGMARSCGYTELAVVDAVRVAMFSTGDELRAPPATLLPGQIYDANRLMIEQMLNCPAIEFTDAGALPDEPAAIQRALEELAAAHDVIVTSGGVSVGDADFVRRAFEAIGELTFYKLNLKPGKPLAVGRIPRSDGSFCEFFGLPGNPVSTLVTALLVLMPALERIGGANPPSPIVPRTVRVSKRFEHRPGREEYQRGILRLGADGELNVEPSGDQGSNRIMSFVEANALVRIPGPHESIEAGDHAEVFELSALMNRLR